MKKSITKINAVDSEASSSKRHVANTGLDQAVISESILLMRTSILRFQEAIPNASPELVGSIFANLLDLWETGKKLDEELHKFKQLRQEDDFGFSTGTTESAG